VPYGPPTPLPEPYHHEESWMVAAYPLEFLRADLDFHLVRGDGSVSGTPWVIRTNLCETWGRFAARDLASEP